MSADTSASGFAPGEAATTPAPTPAPVPAPAPALAGWTVAVLSERRRHAVADALEPFGARTVGVQAVQVFTPAEDAALLAVTRDCLRAPLQELLVTSAFGVRSWLRTARRHRLGEALLEAFAGARLLAANPRAADALRDLGFHVIWSTAASSAEELVRYLLAQRLAGQRIAIQADAPSGAELAHVLRQVGAEVHLVDTFQQVPPPTTGLLRRLDGQILNRTVDAVVLTSPPVAEHLLEQAAADQCLNDMLNRLTGDVPTICLGELTARVLRRFGLRPTVAAAPYPAAVADAVTQALPGNAIHVTLDANPVEIRGQAVVVAAGLIAVPAAPIAVLRALASQPGRVLSCAEIRRAIPHWAEVDDHAIEMAVSRLRHAIPYGDAVQTVLRRGYRLAT